MRAGAPSLPMGLVLLGLVLAQPAGGQSLVNLSALAPVAAGGTLTAGFIIGGNQSETLLIRAVGPTLGSFGVTSPLPHPVLTVFPGASGAAAASNDTWG